MPGGSARTAVQSSSWADTADVRLPTSNADITAFRITSSPSNAKFVSRSDQAAPVVRSRVVRSDHGESDAQQSDESNDSGCCPGRRAARGRLDWQGRARGTQS